MSPIQYPQFCPECGTRLTRRTVAGRERLSCPACEYIHYDNPVPGVGLLIELDEGLVFVQRGGSVKTGRWALPAGYIEADESVEEAAVREAREETGLDVELIDLMGVYSFPEGPPTSGIIVFYRARPLGGTLRAGDDARDARVFLPGDFPLPPFRTHREVLRRWRTTVATPTYFTDRHDDEHAPVTIRLAGPADEAAVLALMRLIAANADLDDADWRAAGQRLREQHTLRVFAAEIGDPPQVVGFVALSLVRTLTGGRGWIDDIAVAVEHQGAGIGAALLEAVLREARRLHLTHLFINVARGSPALRAFARAAGFQESALGVLRLR